MHVRRRCSKGSCRLYKERLAEKAVQLGMRLNPAPAVMYVPSSVYVGLDASTVKSQLETKMKQLVQTGVQFVHFIVENKNNVHSTLLLL